MNEIVIILLLILFNGLLAMTGKQFDGHGLRFKIVDKNVAIIDKIIMTLTTPPQQESETEA